MRIALAHFKDQTLQHLRAPGYLLPTLAMPGLFYFLFEGQDTDVELVTFLMASFAMWAILGVAFFQFGVGIAAERTTPWERFLRTLPLSAGQRLGGRVLSAALFAAVAAAMVIVEAHLINPVSVAADRWLPWLGALLAGGVMVALGESPSATGPARGPPPRLPPWPGCCWPTSAGCGKPPASSRAGQRRSPPTFPPGCGGR
jgi:ABC-2 type transport system permease protein